MVSSKIISLLASVIGGLLFLDNMVGTGELRAPSAVDAGALVATTLPVPRPPSVPTVSTPTLPGLGAIALPVEVLFPNTGEVAVDFVVSDAAVYRQPTSLHLKLFVETENIGYIKVNDYVFRLANSEFDFVQPIKQAFGGFGSGFSVFELNKTLPAGVIKLGTNSVRFAKDRTDGLHLGYRVLDFNFYANASASPLIAESNFTQSNPQTFAGLNSDAVTIADGAQLWRGAQLVKSPDDQRAMRARCSDCHTESGYDLHYFGYSNHSIVQRSVFHGLSENEGKAVASYIRSLNSPGVGRPWNPPYQPGPGLTAKPVNEWAAGAGAEAILAEDAGAIGYAFPYGMPKAYNFKGARLDLTDVPVALELPVWNEWLPRIHPMEDEAFGEKFTRTQYYQLLSALPQSFSSSEMGQLAGLSKLQRSYGNIVVSYLNEIENNSVMAARIHRDASGRLIAGATEKDDIATYSTRQWMLLKFWEAIQLNDLEGLGRELGRSDSKMPASMPVRAFYNGSAFQAAPHKSGVRRITKEYPAGTRNGLRDFKAGDLNWDYFSLSWYYLQMLLWDNFQQGDVFTHWPYMTAFSNINATLGGERYDFPGIRLLTTLKSVEAYSLHPPGGPQDRIGFNNSNGYLKFASERFRGEFGQLSRSEKARVVNSLLYGFADLAASYPARNLNKVNIAEDVRCATKLQQHSDAGCTSAAIYWLIFEWREGGVVEPAVLNRLIDTYAQVWPSFDWDCSRQGKTSAVCLERNRLRGVLF